MPPNVKETATVIDTFATLSVKDLVDSKYAPLTQTTDLFSVSHMEANLIAEAERVNSLVHPPTISDDQYWEEVAYDENDAKIMVKTDEKSQERKSTLTSRDSNKEREIDRILREERTRQLFTIEHIEASAISQESAVIWGIGMTVTEESDGAESYWAWSNEHHEKTKEITPNYWEWPTLTPEEKKRQLIHTILQEERIRELLSTQSIERNLIKTANEISQMQPVSTDDAGSDDYWSW